MTKPPDPDWEELGRDLSARVAAFAPEWTEPEAHDPGVTLVELLGFLAESVLSRADLSPEARTRLGTVIERLQRANDLDCREGTLTRNRFFSGKLLDADALAREQDYHRSRHRRHNRLVHGVGIVHGLGVSLDSHSRSGGRSIVVSPGLALSPEGEELVVCEPVSSDVCTGVDTCYVTVSLAERPVDPTPEGEHSRIDESAEVTVSGDVPTGHLAIARLRRDGRRWQVDSSFEARRVR